jgi:hypothetical protein
MGKCQLKNCRAIFQFIDPLLCIELKFGGITKLLFIQALGFRSTGVAADGDCRGNQERSGSRQRLFRK